jgi:hypothetical protein
MKSPLFPLRTRAHASKIRQIKEAASSGNVLDLCSSSARSNIGGVTDGPDRFSCFFTVLPRQMPELLGF